MSKTEITVKDRDKRKKARAKKAAAVVCGVIYMVAYAMPMRAFAGGDTSAITQPLDNLKTLVIAIIGAVGVIILLQRMSWSSPRHTNSRIRLP